MLQQKIRWIVCLSAILMTCQWVAAADVNTADVKAAPAAEAVKAAPAAETDKLIERLDSAKYEDREAACKKLAELGKQAIPALEKAAVKGDLEVSSRAFGVLSKLLKASDEATSKAAEESLQRLADGDSSGPAHKAKSILDKKNGVANNNNSAVPFAPNGQLMIPGNGGFGGRIIINGGMLQIGGGGAAVKTLSVSNNNGVREIKATEGDKSVKIEDDPANGIKIESTDKVNGKDVTKKYEAKNVEELKKKQPEGYKIYKEYGEQQNGGAVQLQIQGAAIPIGPNAMPAMPLMPAMPMLPGNAPVPAPPALGVAPANGNTVHLDMAAMRLKVISAQLEALRKGESMKDASPEKKAELKKQMDELAKHVDELRKQLDSK